MTVLYLELLVMLIFPQTQFTVLFSVKPQLADAAHSTHCAQTGREITSELSMSDT